jgi:glucosamine--fructose-6-phosphate aminotransferase (isomerizing)
LSDNSSNDGAGLQQDSAPGACSLSEILSQPRCWADCLKQLEAEKTINKIGERFGKSSEWLFIGCGSSYYIALAATASWSALTGTRARAIPASELLLFPDLVLSGARDFVPVLISRSGRTSEVLKAAEFFIQKKIPTLAVSCAAGQRLEELATTTILLPRADEQSTVMTRSFTSMLVALQYLAASLAGKRDFIQALGALPATAEKVLQTLPGRLREFADQHRFSSYVCLGQGPYYGLACESTLKLMEMSCSYAQSFHDLEFRHGPKSIVSRRTLISFLLSETAYDAERDVLEEIKGLGGTTLAIANRIEGRARAAADFVVELDSELPEYARLAPYVFAGQLMGLYTGLQKGLDPDRPTNLSRVVILKEDEERPEHASI